MSQLESLLNLDETPWEGVRLLYFHYSGVDERFLEPKWETFLVRLKYLSRLLKDTFFCLLPVELQEQGFLGTVTHQVVYWTSALNRCTMQVMVEQGMVIKRQSMREKKEQRTEQMRVYYKQQH